MSSSSANYDRPLQPPISALQYRDIALSSGMETPTPQDDGVAAQAAERAAGMEVSKAELEATIRQERADAIAQMERQLRQDYEQKLNLARQRISRAIEEFEAQRSEYFARVEAEVVQLSLSIAARILHREAQTDPMLIAALVRMAVEKMREGSSVTVRVRSGCGADWKRYFAASPNLAHVEVVEDPQVGERDCILETELGTTHFGIEAQLKEVERGFFDLLALRPVRP